MINHTYVVSREEADYDPAIVSRDCNSRIPSTTRKRDYVSRTQTTISIPLTSGIRPLVSHLDPIPSFPGGKRGEDERQGDSPPLRARAEMTSGLGVLPRIFKCSYGAYVLPPRGVSDCIAIFSRRIRADDEDVRVATIRADVSDSAARFRLPSCAVLDSNAVAAFYGR